MTIEVFRSELKKRGFDETQVKELENVVKLYQELNDGTLNDALTAIFDTAVKTIGELRQQAVSEHLAQVEDEILNGYGDRQPTGIFQEVDK